MNQTELNPETRAVLDRIRHSSKFLSVFEMPADLAEAAVWEIGKIVLADRGLPMVLQNGYRWYLRELSKLLRTKTEWDLALELEICLRKWVGYKLDPELLQTLLRECCERIASMSPEDIEESPKDALSDRGSSQVRMTNEARMPEARMTRTDSTTKTQRHEEGPGETRNQRPETRMQNCGGGRDSTTKTQRHEEGTPKRRTSTDYADSTDSPARVLEQPNPRTRMLSAADGSGCVSAAGSNNEG
jgi:hypothetical protein